jgi:hypothetical protein
MCACFVAAMNRCRLHGDDALVNNDGWYGIWLKLCCIIAGLPHLQLEDWQQSLECAVAAKPPHISVYDLQVKCQQHWLVTCLRLPLCKEAGYWGSLAFSS